MVKPGKFDHLHLVYHFTVPLIFKGKTNQEGFKLKSGRVALQRNNEDFRRKKFLRHFSRLL